MSSKETKYHIAIDSQGYMLKGSPERPKRTMKKAPVFGNRFASGDRDYTDLSFWWFWAQTDWSGGFKDSKVWADDAKFWYSTNIDAYSEIGAIRLSHGYTSMDTFNQEIQAGVSGVVDGNNRSYIGCYQEEDSETDVYESSNESSWSSIKSFGSQTNGMMKMFIRDGYLWCLTVGAGTTEVINWWDGSTWEDCSNDAYTGASLTYQYMKAYDYAIIGEDLYISGGNPTNDYQSIVKTSIPNPTGSDDWSKVLDINTGGDIIALEEYEGDLYYLLTDYKYAELRKYDVANSIDNLIQIFHNCSFPSTEFTGRFLHNYNGKLVVTIPNYEIWEYDGSVMTKIWERDDTKYNDFSAYEAVGYLYRGGINWKDKLWWGNLMYDGTYFYNTWKNADDSTSSPIIPVFVNESDYLFFTDTSNQETLYRYNEGTYRSGSDENFIVLNEMEELSTIDKLAHSVTIVFDNFDIGEEIEVYYSLNGGSSFTSLGAASRTLDGGSITQKTFKFGDDVIFNKIMFAVYLNGDGTSSPKLKDMSLQYLPMPDYKYQWTFQVNCTNEFNLLDKRTKEPKTGLELRNLLRASFLKQEIIELEDIDYSETQLNESLSSSDTTITCDSTAGFPEQGTIRIEDEIIKYTGKTAVNFTGCTRGYRGTVAVAHNDDTAVTNKYKALIVEYDEQTPIADDFNPDEFMVQITLIEA